MGLCSSNETTFCFYYDSFDEYTGAGLIRICVRVDEDVAKEVKSLAIKYGIKESEMWRLVITKGLSHEVNQNTQMLIEVLCISRRLSAYTNMEVLHDAKDDAKIILDDLTNR